MILAQQLHGALETAPARTEAAPAPAKTAALLTTEEVALVLRLGNVKTIRVMVARGQLRAIRVGKRLLVRRIDLEAFIGAPLAA
jgi:excisionase family DNA binding protein